MGAAGRLDLAVPPHARIGDLVDRHAPELVGATAGAPREPGDRLRAVTSAGVLLRPEQTLLEARIEDGQVLTVLTDTHHDGQAGAQPLARSAGAAHRPGTVSRPVVLAFASVCALTSCIAVATDLGRAGTHAEVAPWCAGLLLLGAALGVVRLQDRIAGTARARSVATPVLGAGGGFLLGVAPGPQGLLLGLTVAALSGLVFAAVSRAVLRDDEDDLVEVVLAVGGVTAVLSVSLLLLGSSATSLLAALYAASVVAARLLPYLVVDVPDEALLDLDRLAVTAWSAREVARGGGRRRALVRPDDVASVVGRGQRQVSAATVALTLLVATAGPLLVVGALDRDLRSVVTLVMIALGGVALTLMARTVRSHGDRLALRLTSAWVLGFLGVSVAGELGEQVRWPVALAAVVVAVVVVAAAISLGQGWRSVRWTRVADVVEALSIVLVLASSTIASGLFDAVRGFVS